MTVPDILPDIVPIGTKFNIQNEEYEFLSIGVKRETITLIGYVSTYTGSVRNLKTNAIHLQYDVYLQYIDWDSINFHDIKTSTNLIKKCFWCKEDLGPHQKTPYCEIGKKYCKEYYLALEERMKLDFRIPEEALEYDINSVRRYINNLYRIK